MNFFLTSKSIEERIFNLFIILDLLAHLMSFLVFFTFWGSSSFPIQSLYQFIFLMVLSYILIIVYLTMRKNYYQSIIFFLKLIIITLIIYPLQNRIYIHLLLTYPLLFFVGIKFKRTYLITFNLIFICHTFICHQQALVWGIPINNTGILGIILVLFIGITSSTIGSFIRRYILQTNEEIMNLSIVAMSSKELADVNIKLQRYVVEIEKESINNERKRITRELHDSIGYILTNQNTLLEVAIRLLGQLENKNDVVYELKEILFQAKKQTKEGLNDVRQVLYLLRDIAPSHPIGINRIRRLINAFKNTPIIVILELQNIPANSFSEEIDYLFFRIVQEGITNALRHGNATTIKIIIWSDEKEAGVTVIDNGISMTINNHGIGLIEIEENTAKIGGSMKAQKTINGFELAVRIPWRKMKR